MPRARAVAPPPSLPAGAAFSRRRFLALGSAVAAGAWAGELLAAPAETAEAAGWAAVGREWPLSVGFVEGSERLADLRALPWERREPARSVGLPRVPVEVVPAAALGLGDQTLAYETVSMRVAGLYPGMPPRRRADGFASADLTVFVPSSDPFFPDPLPFYCWGSRRLPGRSTAAPTRFVVPLREDGGLEVVLEVRMPRRSGLEEAAWPGRRRAADRATPPPTTVHRFYADFTVDWYDGRPKLQRGLYLLGLAPGIWDAGPVELPGPRARPRHDLCSLAVSFEPLAEGAAGGT